VVAVVHGPRGRAVQVDPIKLVLKAPGTIKRSKLECEEPLSNFAFNFNLRRHTAALPSRPTVAVGPGRHCSPPHWMPCK